MFGTAQDKAKDVDLKSPETADGSEVKGDRDEKFEVAPCGGHRGWSGGWLLGMHWAVIPGSIRPRRGQLRRACFRPARNLELRLDCTWSSFA